MADRKTVYLIDGTAYIYRGFHAVRGLSTSNGLPTNAVFSFTRMLIKLMETARPEYLVMFFDAKGPTFRHQMFDAYKANRPPMPDDLAIQIPYIKSVTEAFNLPIVELSGYEADDLIGTYAVQAAEAGFEVVMVTGDKDFMQLVGENRRIFDPMKERWIDPASIFADIGLTPDQIVDMMGLSGDTADNVPGVPGVGPKTAQTLIKAHGSLDGIYDAIDTLKGKRKANLENFKDQAYLSRDLVRIRTDAPVSFDPEVAKRREPDRPRLSELFQELEFRNLQQEYFDDTPAADKAEKVYMAVMDEKALSDLAARLKKAGIFSVDTETTGLDPMRAKLVGISVSDTPHEGFYIPVGHDGPDDPKQLSIDIVKAILGPILTDASVKKIGQNIKYDWIILSRHGFALEGVWFDTMIASYLLDPGKHAHGLDQIAMDHLGHKMISYESVAGKGKNAICFSKVPLSEAVPYACEDADITLKAYHLFSEKLEALALIELMRSVEMPLLPVLMEMEKTGVRVDREVLSALSDAFAAELEAVETAVFDAAGETFNLRSSQQLGHVLFETLGLPVVKKTRKKTGYSTDVDVLTRLAEQHEVPALVLRHRTLAKLKSAYTDNLMELVNPDTGRIHTSFNQTVTATGRLSSSDPNLQNIPIRSDEGRRIRSAFIPREGWEMLSADYSQIELRVLAHYADDPTLIAAFVDDEDIHTRTAAEVFESHPALVTPELRRQAKAINFGIIYGMGAYRLSQELGITRKMAQTYIDHYFSRYPRVKIFMDERIREAEKTLQVKTLLGRIRRLPDMASTNKNLRQAAERLAVNTVIQGTAADLIKLAMIRVAAAMEDQGLQSAMLLSVHDEMVFEVPPEEKADMEALVRREMETVVDFRVPLKVNLAWGRNWTDAH